MNPENSSFNITITKDCQFEQNPIDNLCNFLILITVILIIIAIPELNRVIYKYDYKYIFTLSIDALQMFSSSFNGHPTKCIFNPTEPEFEDYRMY